MSLDMALCLRIKLCLQVALCYFAVTEMNAGHLELKVEDGTATVKIP